LGIVLANLGRAADLVRSFKQVAADQASEAPRRIALRSYVEDVLRNVQPIMRRGGIALELDVPEAFEITTHCGALAQVLTNLVQNAALHAFDGVAAPKIVIAGGPAGEDRAFLRFSDNGVGMDAAVRQKAFDPFFTTRRESGGTGLGLHIVHNLVVGPLKGEVRLETAPGAGTSFVILFQTGGLESGRG
jgi:signal transduction histidine kinase